MCIEAQENAESFTSELDQVKITLKQTEEEKSRLEEELTRVNYFLAGLLLYVLIPHYNLLLLSTLIQGKKYIEKRNYKS